MKKGKAKILVIEDDPAQAMMYQVALVAAGFKVFLADTAATGLALAVRQQPDLIFLDMVLPDADGLATLKTLKTNLKTAGIKIIVLSNLNKREVIDQSLRSGAADFLVKMQFLPKEVAAKAKEQLN